MLPTQQASRKPPKKQLSVIPAQLDCFQKSDTVKTLDHLSQKTTPAGFQKVGRSRFILQSCV